MVFAFVVTVSTQDPAASVDWGAIAVFVVLLGLAGHSIQHGLLIQDRRSRSHGSKCSKLRAEIQGERVIPHLAELFCRVLRPETLVGRDGAPLDEEDLTARVHDSLQGLQGVSFLDELKELSDYHNDLRLVDARYRASLRWARTRAAMAAVAVATMLAPAIESSLETVTFLSDLQRVSLLGATALAAVLAALCWVREAASINVLAKLGDKYDVHD